MTNGDYKFGMEVPDAMISDAIKKKAGYTYYIAKKVKSEKAMIVDEPEEQHVSPVQNGKGKGLMCYGNLVKSFSIQEPCTQQRQRSQLTINSQTNEAVADMYNEWGQKLKGPAVKDPAVQSLLDLRKRSKASRLENTDSDATLYSSSSNKTEESANETDDVDESDMGLSNDNPNGANDDARHYGGWDYGKTLAFVKADEPIYESKSNMTHPTNQKLYDTLYESIYLDHDALNVQDAESPFHKWSHDNQDSPNNRGGGDKKKHQKDVSEPSSRSSRRNKSLVIHEQSGSTGATKRNTTWFDLLLKLDIDKNENHILGPSTIAIVKKLKAIIQKDELTIANLEGCQTRKAKATWGGGGYRHVAARGGGDRVDRVMGRLLGLGRKTRRKSFPVAGGGAGVAVVVAGKRERNGGVWRNKPDLDTISFDDLYNNFKIVEQEVKRTASSSSSLSSQNMAFVSSPSSTNEVNIGYGDSTDNTQVSPASTQVSTASTQLALLSMRTRRFFQKTGRKITINGSDTARYDKSKVECFNCHKMGHFARECRGPRNHDSRNRNQDSSRRTVPVEETSSKAMVAIDGAGFDWSYMANDEVPTNMAFMAFSKSEVYNDKTCSNTCLKSFETLKTQLDDLRIEFNKSEFNLATYKRGLASVEEQLVFYKKNEVMFCEQIAVLKRDISYKNSEISVLKSELEKLKQEKESNQLKINKFNNASKRLFSPPKLDLSNSSIKEFQQPEFEGYRPKTSKSVSEDTFNEVRESPDVPLVEELVSDDKLENKIVFPTIFKIEFVRPKQQEKPVRKPVKYAEMYRLKAVNTARLNSAVVNAVRENQGYPQKEDQGYVHSGFSRHMTGNMSYLSDFKEFDGGYVTFGGGAKGEKITGKGTLKTGHVNFKTINKLVKENLVRGLPTKRFENDQTFVACLKGKQHKASCKSKIQNSITQPLFMLHMDLFGLTFVSSLMNKKYCLVVTDDYSKFTWVFFLASKDETSGILKSFITEIENLVDKKVKIIRCDNGTEFKNRVMSKFCKKKGIKREFSIARTPQQNGVAERRNRTLIEAARTMLADSKLPTTFWAEAVNTACYVQNRVLVVKPHNKTPYELFRGRTPALSFMRPFGCHVTILNTLDYLGKFDGKSDEGFFVGYSLNSDGPKWLFDIDVLTKSMNYVPVVAGTNSNDFIGTEESIGAGHSSKETGSSQDYILMPLWKDGSLFDSSSKNASNFLVMLERRMMKVTNVNTSSLNINIVSPTVTTAPLEATHTDFFDDETEMDMSNITNTYPVSSTQNTRIHKDHPLTQIIRDIMSPPQTRRMSRNVTEHEAIQEELLQFKLQKVWVLVDLPKGKRAIGTKWIFRNKKDERGIVIRNKARLMDVKSAFLYGQPRGFENPDYPDKVYKVVKALYGLHQAPRAWTASTPMDTDKALIKDSDGDDVDVHLHMSMIGSLMYLTSSRPDIMFAVCACARFQVTPKVSHLHVVKRITRYLKGQPKLGLSYPRDSSFDFVAYSDSDYAGASLDRKSTTGGCQFLGCRLISWQCKKQIVVATSSTEAEYMAAASCCGQVLLIQNQMLDYGGPIALVTNETVTKEWEDRMERVATTTSSLEAEQASGNIIRTQSMATLNEPSPQGTGSGSGPSTLDNEEMEISATIDGKVKILTEASVKRHLKLEDSDGIMFLNKHKRLLQPHTRLYIAPTLTQKLFRNMKRTSKGYTGVDIPLFPTMLIHGPIFQGEGSTVLFDSHHTPTGASSTSQPHLSPTLRSSIRQETEVPRPSSPPHINVQDEAASIGVDVTPPKMCRSGNVSGGVTS
ncbi:retrovirus-related pol polyprotein from transposon TNT 1-94 [Tanacetum coccineum]